MSEYAAYKNRDKAKHSFEDPNDPTSQEEQIEFYSPWYSGNKISSYSSQ